MNDSPFCNRPTHNGACCCPHKIRPDRTCVACMAAPLHQVPVHQPAPQQQEEGVLMSGGLGIDGVYLEHPSKGIMPGLLLRFLDGNGSGAVVASAIVPFKATAVAQMRAAFEAGIAHALKLADEATATDMECPACKNASRAARRTCNTCAHTGRVPKPTADAAPPVQP